MIFSSEFQKRVYPVRKFKKASLSAKRKEPKFSNGVYEVVKKIPRGKVLTYKQIAVKLGNPKLARVVGNALSKNKDPKVPCHRVVRSNGQVGGYTHGTKKKEFLLKKEGVSIKNRRVVL